MNERKKCTKTTSGEHVFMPIDNTFTEMKLLYVLRRHGISDPLRCVACERIKDD